jgi:hypothetical protein
VYLCKEVKIMPTIEENMGDYLDQLEKILDRAESERREHFQKMQEQRELNNRQLTMYKEVLDASIMFNKERLDGMDKRIGWFTKIALALLPFVAAFVAAGFTVNTRVSKIEDYVREQDPAQKTEVTNSIGVVVDETRDALENVGMDKEDAYKYEKDAKGGVTRAMGDISRGVK